MKIDSLIRGFNFLRMADTVKFTSVVVVNLTGEVFFAHYVVVVLR